MGVLFNDYNTERKTSGMTVERINGKALKELMKKANVDVKTLSYCTHITQKNINNFIKGKELLIDSLNLCKISLVINCAPADLVLIKGESSPVYEIKKEDPEVPRVSLRSLPAPNIKENKVYTVYKRKTSKDMAGEKDQKLVLVKKANGHSGTIHYIFKNVDGGFLISYTEDEIKLGDIVLR